MMITYVYFDYKQIEVKKRIESIESRNKKLYSKPSTDLNANYLFFSANLYDA